MGDALAGTPEQVVVLAAGTARAWVAAELGANVLRWQRGDWDILPASTLDDLRARPARSGVPVLFPFPGRIRGGRYTWRGVERTWAPLDDQGNAKHGFALREPWDVVDRAASRATCRLDIGARPHLLRLFPFPCVVDLTIHLTEDALAFEVRVENTGNADLPMGFGLHPYFALPLGPSGSREASVIRVPAHSRWELADALPTGAILPAEGRLDLLNGRLLGDNAYDDVLTEVVGDVAAIEDPASGRRLLIHAAPADGFREWVVFTPEGRSSVALEPYTCPPDAFNLAARGRDVGLIVVPPGGIWESTIHFEVHA